MPAKEVLSPAPSAAMRKSHASAKERPAPAATPLSAAMTGLFIVARRDDDRVVVVGDRRRQRGVGVREAAHVLLEVLSDTERTPRPGQHDASHVGVLAHL